MAIKSKPALQYPMTFMDAIAALLNGMALAPRKKSAISRTELVRASSRS